MIAGVGFAEGTGVGCDEGAVGSVEGNSVGAEMIADMLNLIHLNMKQLAAKSLNKHVLESKMHRRNRVQK